MRKTTYQRTRGFRTTTNLDDALRDLATKVNRHESDICRTAVWEFVRHHATNPKFIEKVV